MIRAAAAVAVTGLLLCAPVAGGPARAQDRPLGEGPAGGAAEHGSPAGSRPVADLVRDADAAYARDDYKTARALYEEAVAAGDGTPHTLRRLALLQSWDGDLDASIDTYRRALKIAPDDVDLLLEYARVLTWKDDLKEAIVCYEGLRARHADDPRVLLGLGQALAWRGRYAEADAVYREMEDHRIETIKAHLGRAQILAWSGEYDEAGRFYRDILKADPGNLEARLGLARAEHWQGLDRTARAQADNIVLDHPDSKEARDLQTEIHKGLRPRALADAFRYSDNDSNRVDGATAGVTFMGEPQTSIRIALSGYDASWRCKDPALCDEFVTGPGVNEEVSTRASVLMAGVTSRLIRPLHFHARLGAVREESFDGSAVTGLEGGARTRLIGGGYIRWQVGPRFTMTGYAARDPLLDTPVLIDKGITVDSGDAVLEFRFRPAWNLAGSGGYALYSDGNRRLTAGAAVTWRLPVAHPYLTSTVDLRYRSFQEDLNHGYFDPLRFDSELLTVAVWDDLRHGRFYWGIEATIGRQAFDTDAGPDLEAGGGDTVQAFYAMAGIGLDDRAGLEAFYSRGDYALQLATGFEATRTGVSLRYRF